MIASFKFQFVKNFQLQLKNTSFHYDITEIFEKKYDVYSNSNNSLRDN